MWTDEQVDEVRRMTVDGMSASQIGIELNRTRNSIIGVWHRKNIAVPRREKLIAERTRLERSKRSDRVSRPTGAPKINQAAKDSPNAPLTAARLEEINQPLAESRPVTLMKRRPGQCCWPLGDPKTPEFRYCGAPTRGEASSYCDGHRALMTRPGNEKS